MSMIMLILGLFLPTVVILLFIGAIINNKKGNESSVYTKGVRIAYTYVLVIAALLMIVVGTIGTVNYLLDYFMPESELEITCDRFDVYNKLECLDYAQQLKVENEKREGLIGAVTCLAMAVVGIPIFVYNSKEAKKYKDEKKAR